MVTSTEKFRVDLAKGQEAQNKIFAQLMADGWEEVDGDRMKHYDGEYALIDHPEYGTLRIEVKHEIKYGHLPTCYVEYECNSKRSGIRSSKADVFIHICKEECFIYSKLRMLEFYYKAIQSCSTGKAGMWEWKEGGDRGVSKGLIINREALVDATCNWVKICKFEEISSTLKLMLRLEVI